MWPWTMRKKAQAAVTPGMAVLTPAMAALTPPRELAKRWRDFLPLLAIEGKEGRRGKGGAPVFLALGGDDGLRRRLWLSTPECRCLRDEASGLSFAVYPDSVWVDVPASFVAPPDTPPGHPVLSAGAPGLWEELAGFLPELRGELRGALVFVDARQEEEAAARNSQWLSGKLNALCARFRKNPPAVWIACSGLERFPGGRSAAEKLAVSGDGGRALLGEVSGGRMSLAAFVSCIERLEEKLGAFIRAADAAGQGDAFSPEAHLLRSSLPAMTHNAKTLCAALGTERRARAATLGGVFLCGGGGAGQSLPFAAALPRSLIPGSSGAAERERRASGKPGAARYALVWLFLVAAASGLAVLHFRAKECLDALPFRLLEASPDPGGFGGAPPVARYARARAELNRLSRDRTPAITIARRIFRAPVRGLAAAEKRFADNLRSWLPASDDPARIDAWLDGLAEWVETGRGIDPMPFETLAGRRLARIRGAHGGAGRAAAAKLLSEWRGLLDDPSRAKIDLLQTRYDERLHADWRRSGAGILAAVLDAADADDFAVVKDFIASDPGFVFIAKAGEELEFAGGGKTEWAKAAAAIAGLNRAPASAPGAEPPSPAALKLRAYRDALAAIYPRSLDVSALADLAADAYSPPGGNPPPPSLLDVDASWIALATALPALEPSFGGDEGGDVLALLGSRHSLSFRAAVTQAAKRVQDEWERMVLLPPAALDSDAKLLLMLEQKPFAAFAGASAKPFLAVRDNRLAPAAALGRAFPFRPEAVEWLNKTAAAVARLDGEYPLRLTLLPVTAGKTPRIFPRGVRFTWNAAEPVSATGYNNTVASSFAWSVKNSLGVEFAVLFDSFTLEKKYPGATGAIRFLRSLDRGSLLLSAADFPDRRKELERCGVERIRVHFAVHDPLGAGTLEPDLPPPPAAAVMPLRTFLFGRP